VNGVLCANGAFCAAFTVAEDSSMFRPTAAQEKLNPWSKCPAPPLPPTKTSTRTSVSQQRVENLLRTSRCPNKRCVEVYACYPHFSLPPPLPLQRRSTSQVAFVLSATAGTPFVSLLDGTFLDHGMPFLPLADRNLSYQLPFFSQELTFRRSPLLDVAPPPQLISDHLAGPRPRHDKRAHGLQS